MKLYISSSCSQHPSIFDAIKELADAGFTHIELSGGNEYAGYNQEYLLELKNKRGLTFLVHNYFPPQPKSFVLNIATANPVNRQQCFVLVQEAVNLSRLLKQTHYGIHSGYNREMTTAKDMDGVFTSIGAIPDARKLQEVFLEKIKNILPSGFRLAIENAFPHKDNADTSLMYSTEHIEKFLQGFDGTPIGLLLDLGHLGVSACMMGFDKFAFLQRLLPQYYLRIFEIHLSTHNEDIDTHWITQPDTPDVQMLASYRSLLQHIPVTLEWQNADCTEAFAAYQRLCPILEEE
ncbi:hypothetical protein FACS1894137_11130 [Spirochaetia bacterium]|nr:hypothetical protein FACS1894137_11130 [Spirochaetia bacterium]